MEQILLVLTNLPDTASAQSLARVLVESRLAACVNLMPGVQSFYRWQGAIEQANEVTLLIKTTRRHYVQLQQAIISHHPYEVPEVIAMPVTDGHPAYLRWVATETLSDPAADDHA
jgi:periplasmic divalent cation tolerance protein